LLAQLKVQLTRFDFLLLGGTDTALFVITREILENAVLLSIKEKDSEAFERDFAQLKAYYTDSRNAAVGESERKYPLLGCNLLRLLALDRLAEFHTELELIPIQLHLSNVYIRHSIQLEQFLMEGSYNKIFAAQRTVPAEYYAHFMQLLMGTVRSQIAASIEKAYTSLRMSDAEKLLRLQSRAELLEFMKQRKWLAKDDIIEFVHEDKSKKQTIPAMELIHQTLSYAKELERII